MKKHFWKFAAVLAAFTLAVIVTGCGGGNGGSVNQTPEADHYTFSNMNQTAGSVTDVIITKKDGKSPGAVNNIRYDGGTTIPQEEGDYAVTFDVAAAAGWNPASGLSAGTLIVGDPLKQTPAAADYNFSNMSQTAGSVTAVTIEAKSGKSPGAVSNIRYDGSITIPQEEGDYAVTFDVAAAEGWNAASNLSAGNLAVKAGGSLATITVETAVWTAGATYWITTDGVAALKSVDGDRDVDFYITKTPDSRDGVHTGRIGNSDWGMQCEDINTYVPAGTGSSTSLIYTLKASDLLKCVSGAGTSGAGRILIYFYEGVGIYLSLDKVEVRGDGGIVPVTNISGVPTTGTAGSQRTLSGTVSPSTATNKTIVWSLGTGSTAPGAAVSEGKASAAGEGTVVVKATITNGAAVGTDYTQNFTINFRPAPIPGTFPTLSTTKWTRVGPDGIDEIFYSAPGSPNGTPTNFHQGMAIDPNNTDILYLTVGCHDTDFYNGILKSTDRGTTWEWLYKGINYNNNNSGVMPVNIRVDPSDSDRLYVVEMIKVTDGIKLSTDGGQTWQKHPGWASFASTHNLHNNLYHMAAIDPLYPKHLLVTTKGSGGGWDQWAAVESFDGGDTWHGINKPAGLNEGYGWNTWYLRHPNPAFVNSGADGKRMLLGTQEGSGKKGFYLTTDAGATWTHIIGPDSAVYPKDINMQHGGGTVFYDVNGDLYISATSDYKTPQGGQILKSTDNGATWSSFSNGFQAWNPFLFVIGYNGKLYASPHQEGSGFFTTSTTSANWQPMQIDNNGWDNKDPNPANKDMMFGGAFEFVLDETNKILYASCVSSGVYALQLE